MQITVTISDSAVARVQNLAKCTIGRDFTEQELQEFFAGDVQEIYGSTFEDSYIGGSVQDAVESYCEYI